MDQHTPFFITGLPRTRSAWLANLFTTGDSLCFHEPMATVTELVARHTSVRVGVADSTLVFNAGMLMGLYPEAPWLFVDRPAKDARKSLIRFAAPTVRLLGREADAFFRAHELAAHAVRKHPRTLVVSYRELDTRIGEVWAHLLPGVQFWRERYEILRGLKVEQRFAEALKGAV